MPKITKVYTRAGDEGTTSLGGGQRVDKHSLRIESYGTVDELNSAIGVALAGGLDPRLEKELGRVQNELFHLGSDLCVLEEDKHKFKVPCVEQRHIDTLEATIDELNEQLGPLENFILPGGSAGAASLHLARTIARRAERLLVALSREQTIGPHTLAYLNRLSDALFVMARFENHRQGVEDVCWDSRA
ncbi:cob(I)yrinic acid a c-diamide adenosyltransferase [Acidobacteria bacterium Mor1]|nr:cob(I)yrinic acid a c-diamide adenosyltransferase [Acidobacteria bacterium Mor1]